MERDAESGLSSAVSQELGQLGPNIVKAYLR